MGDVQALPPPALSPLSLTDAAPGMQRHVPARMERTTSEHIRYEQVELKEAAEQSLNIVLDLASDGTIRWVSRTWEDVVGTTVESVLGKPIAESLPAENGCIFSEAVDIMRKDDSKSKIIRFAIQPGPKSRLRRRISRPIEDADANDEQFEDAIAMIELEGQGIVVYDRATGAESHTMWMIRPSVVREVTIDLPPVLIESLGVGAEILAHHLTSLAEAGAGDPEHHPPPMPVLCRICERSITPWWFPKHTELCLQEYRAEAELQMAQDTLIDHRSAIVKVLDALEAQMRLRQRQTSTEDRVGQAPQAEYKGMVIGALPSSHTSSGRASPGSPSRSRDHSTSGASHQRAKSFAVRRPLSRIVELILDLCDTALEINTPALKDTRGLDDELRTQSPSSEGRVSQVLQWQSPSQGALENEPGLVALCDDTNNTCKAKVEAVLKFRRMLEYSERIRAEVTTLVQECVDAALEKAAKINAGEDVSSEDEVSDHRDLTDDELTPAPSKPRIDEASIPPEPVETTPAMAAVMRRVERSASSSPNRRLSSAISTRSNSPRGCPTPRSNAGVLALPAEPSQGLVNVDGDQGTESDSSVWSTVITNLRRVESPAEGLSLSRTRSSRERKRTSLVLPRAISSNRESSPIRNGQIPVSPLRIPKPRMGSGGTESNRSPIMSPVLTAGEFSAAQAFTQHQRHHRRQSSVASSEISNAPHSPRLSFASHPQPRAIPPSIKDFEIIKPISKGAFGSVYLAKKKSTGDYFAIKALKKADMISKNQVANVKAERAIMMWQGESEFVAKLYWTFPSKDYIFLVMEYLNGGDCASLVKALGTLPEDWAKRYIAEVVEGVEHLHEREIVHRDLKPDNLLIDQKGHLKLTDFGLSRMGLIGRQKRALKSDNTAPDLLKQGPFHRSVSVTSSRSTSFDYNKAMSPAQTPHLFPAYSEAGGQPSYFTLSRESSGYKEPTRQSSGHQSDYGDGDSLNSAFRRFSIVDESWNSRHSPQTDDAASQDDFSESNAVNSQKPETGSSQAPTPPTVGGMAPPPMALFDPDDNNRKFIGTPDYLAPETINGLGQDEMSDWWSIGCILFEFLFGYPPFTADTPEKVFENILARRIDWPPEDAYEVSKEAKDLMDRLMCVDASKRLGSNPGEKFASGGEEIKKHPWFAGIDWERLNEAEPSFVPVSDNPEDTEYFDTRGAAMENFSTEFDDQGTSPATTPNPDFERPHDALSRARKDFNPTKRGLMPLHIPPHVRDTRVRRLSEPAGTDDFGQFSFKNLPVLEKANKDVIQKLRVEAMQAQARASQGPYSAGPTTTAPSLESSPILSVPPSRALSINRGSARPSSPSAQLNANSSPNRASQPSSPLVQFSAGRSHERRKTSSSSSTLSVPATNSATPAGIFEVPRLPTNLKIPSAISSPIKGTRAPVAAAEGPSSKSISDLPSPRTRSQTVGSGASDGDLIERRISHVRPKSQVLDFSPSSSDTEDLRQKNMLLRVQRRRQSSRRLSQITLSEGPLFRPLDVLICEDHPVSRLVMEKLLEKLRCRTVISSNGPEAMRYALSAVKFDIIMMEFKLPQINGADVARMIRETKNANCHTPIVAVTGYLKELQAPHHFDALVEKPPTMAKLTEVMSHLCQWKPPPPGWPYAGQMPYPAKYVARNDLSQTNDSPTSTSSGFAALPSSSYHGSSREDSVSSVSLYGDADVKNDDFPVFIKRPATDDWQDSDSPGFGGLGFLAISESPPSQSHTHARSLNVPPTLGHAMSAPVSLESSQPMLRTPSAEAVQAKRLSIERDRHECAESGDDEDDELGNRARSRSPKVPGPKRTASKLGIEMLRTNSQGSVISTIGDNPPAVTSAPIISDPATGSIPRLPLSYAASSIAEENEGGIQDTPSATTPPEIFPQEPGDNVTQIMDLSTVSGFILSSFDGPLRDATDIGTSQTYLLPDFSRRSSDIDPDPTPKANTSPSHTD